MLDSRPEESVVRIDSAGEKRKRLPKAAVWAAALAPLLLAAAVAVYVWSQWRPVPASSAPVRVRIEPGMMPDEIARELERAGLIRDARMFWYYLRLKGEGNRFQAGEYELKPGMTPDELIAALNAGNTIRPETVRVTIPEGFTVRQIADRLEESGIADAAAVLGLAADPKAFPHAVIREIPADPRMRWPLEGYLFPETYEWPKGVDETAVLSRMIEEFERRLNALPEGWRSRLDELGLTLHGLVTVASLVEREAALEEERPLVASVIYNRLKRGMLLQIDATVQYLLDEPVERLTERELRIDSPYNTYRYPGLPPGPIASPGMSSIRAALFPAETEYLYYVVKNDGSRGHWFAKTEEEHYRNVRESRKAAEKSAAAP